MKKRILALVFASFLIVGCGSSSSEPAASTPSEPPVSGGSGAYQSDISGGGGYVNVEYILKENTEVDYLSFFVVHYIGGQSYEHYFPSAFSNGSLIRVEVKVYIPANDSGEALNHKIDVEYFADDRQVINTYEFTQEPEPEEPVEVVEVEVNA